MGGPMSTRGPKPLRSPHGWHPRFGLSKRDEVEIAIMAELPIEHMGEALRRMRSWRFRLRLWWRRLSWTG